eukprot:Protomagalhaensia_wolfi_Nauph_80__4288@NODE_4377_length_583_cov_49_003676_g3495_i0_p1_GENE_NODE_4377_length_583_cov_49_003676_g3495_i0NODE_4377_length_583_cov_49_003676_g3495_i0_p1_ORF_typecomplete_len153_score0_54_NODE_4377_length_583_cov_49_003676_g3495_i094552
MQSVSPGVSSGYQLGDHSVAPQQREYERLLQGVQGYGPPPPNYQIRSRAAPANVHGAYEGDPRAHLLMRPHRKYYISKREKGCLGACNAACCCGAFDRDAGLCGYLNCCGCCDREAKLLKRIGSFTESDNIAPRGGKAQRSAAWCSGCCCAY